MPLPTKFTEKALNPSADVKHEDPQTKNFSSGVEGMADPSSKITYLSLFRYATTYDVIGFVLSSIFAVAAGAILPCLTVRPNSFLREYIKLTIYDL